MILSIIICSILSLLFFSFYDYVKFNKKKLLNQINVYRKEQWKVQLLIGLGFFWINYFFTKSWIGSGLVFYNYIILWWTWWTDLLYFGFFNTLKWYKSENTKPFTFEVIGKKSVNWFTFFGLCRLFFMRLRYKTSWIELKKYSLSWSTLLIQLILGLIYLIVLNFLLIKYFINV